MKFANVEGVRRQAQRGLAGSCPVCGDPVIAKCGSIVAPHWAHKGSRRCDHWWENETSWHRNWKSLFPDTWHEIVKADQDGTRHIADVYLPARRTIEFQHSPISKEERQSREAFWPDLFWIVDGRRRRRDAAQFAKIISTSNLLSANPFTLQVGKQGSALLRDWHLSNRPVTFDFGQNILWRFSKTQKRGVWRIQPVQKHNFVLWLSGRALLEGLNAKGSTRYWRAYFARMLS